ncbi:MAG: transporter substrate-binding domain-containing protein [Candidatus Aerophobetes bacterium]|nr:transporter substrate-binding domain-containing protein [Candidatus Aerophobetes bacterium]
MRRGEHVFLAIAGLMVCLAAWWALARLGREAEDETWARIQREGVMRVGMDASWPPFEYVEGDEIVGFDVDLAREIGERLGVRVELVNAGFDGLYDALQAGRFDAIVSALPYDPTLTEDVAYSISYFDAGQVLVVRASEGEIRGAKDLAGKRLGVEWGSEGDMQGRKLQKKIEGLTLQPYMSPRDVLQALKNSEVDAALVDAVSALQFIGSEGGVRIVGHPLTDERYVVAVHPESHVLLEAINGALAEMRKDGTLDRLREKWFGGNLS